MGAWRCRSVVPGVLLLTCWAGARAQERADSLSGTLDEVVVNGERVRNLIAPEMGRVTLTGDRVSRLPVMLGEPDLVKALQAQPGVTHGVEGFSGLYVHGGENDQNLFLFQGLPLHQVSHLGGVFSSFNVAAVNRADFYKSSYPARYGGRISSITDITMNAPSLERYTGQVSVGLISGNLYLSGPIAKGRTGFSLGIRRTWLELVSIPALAIINANNNKGKTKRAGYAFTDLNLRLDHHFSSSLTGILTAYYSEDRLNIGERQTHKKKVTDPDKQYFDDNTNHIRWGNAGAAASLTWTGLPGRLNGGVFWTACSSRYRQEHEYQTMMSDPSTYGYSLSETFNSISTFGAKADYVVNPNSWWRLSAGGEWTLRRFVPDGLKNRTMADGTLTTDDSPDRYVNQNTMAVWTDHEFTLHERVSVSIGLRVSGYRSKGDYWWYLEPRAAMRVSLTDNLSLKAAYASMSQGEQQISNNYISLPTDLWQPTVAPFAPLRSHNVSLGLSGNLPYDSFFAAELWWKTMKGLLEYREGVSALNPGLSWQEKLTSGRGYAYGLDLTLARNIGKWTGSIGYGLMWNRRKFADLNQGRTFPAKFDNRHKINLGLTFRPSDRWEFNAQWVYMTGNRLTLAMYNYDSAGSFFPDAPSVDIGDYVGGDDQLTGIGYYPERNNIRLPAYHRLDLGASLFKPLKGGRMIVWNFGLYNAYCHMNAMTIQKDPYNDDYQGQGWHRTFRTFSLLPVIPSFSFTYKF